MRYRLRTLLIVLALGPPLIAGAWVGGKVLRRWSHSEDVIYTPGGTGVHPVGDESLEFTTSIEIVSLTPLGSALLFLFTIRDVLWLTVLVGMGCGWFFDRRLARRWQSSAKQSDAHFRSLLTEFERAMPGSVTTREDGQITVTTKTGDSVIYPKSNLPDTVSN